MLADRRRLYSESIAAISLDQVSTLVEAIREMRSGRTCYVAGNGGSCANAAHLVLHLREVGFRAVDLTADTPYLTAIANDSSYRQVFSRLLESQATQEDALLVISGSGNSPNIISALVEARRCGMRTLGLLGFGGGRARALCDVAVVMDSIEYGPVEVAHDACVHLIKEMLASPN